MRDQFIEFNSPVDLFRWTKRMGDEWDFKKPLRVKWGISRPGRSAQQNSLMWLWLTEIEEQTGVDKEDIHDRFKYEYAVPIFMRDDEGYAQMIQAVKALRKLGMDNEYKTVRKFIVENTSTTDFDTKQMTEYLDRLWRYAVVERGYRLSHPDDRGMDWMKLESMAA